MPAQIYQLIPVAAQDAPQDVGQGFRMFSGYPDVMSTAQAADALGASQCWLREAAARGEVKSFHVGRLLKFSKAALIEFIERGGAV